MAKDKMVGGTLTESLESKTEKADDSLRSALTAAMDGEEAEEETGQETAEDAAETAQDAQTEDAAEDTAEAETAASDDDSAAEAESGEDAETEDSDDEIEAPAHWALEDQELFRQQPVEVQKYLLGRHKSMEADYTKKSQEVAPFRKAIEPWQPYLQSLNVKPEDAFNMLMSAQYQLQTGSPEQKREALLKIAKDYGISLEGAKPANGQDAQHDGVFSTEIDRVIQPLRDELGQLKTAAQTREQQALQAQAAEAEKTVQAFRDAKTEAGKPAHPHFDEVQDDMTRLAQADRLAGRTPDLADLYERAVWANPTVRAKLTAAQQHAAKRADEQRRKGEVQKAKKAAVSVTGGPAGTREQPKSLREDIAAAFDGAS